MKNKFLKIFFCKKIFYPPKKAEILILDEIYQFELCSMFKRKKVGLLKIRYEELNIFIIIKMLLSFKKINFFNYMTTYINYVYPKVVITGNDYFIGFYKLKNFCPKIYFIAIQNGVRSKLFFEDFKKEKNINIDYAFTFNKTASRYYRKYVKCKTLETGSFRNNYFVKKKRKKRKSILFVSTGFPRDGGNMYHGDYIVCQKEDFYGSDAKALALLSKFCEEKNMIIEFVPKYLGDEGKKEYMYYKKFFKYNKIIFHNKPKISYITYKIADTCQLVFATSSTFGFESLARGNITAIFNNKSKITKNFYNIFWCYKNFNKKNGFFWSNDLNYKELSRILEDLLKRKNQKKYLNSLKKYKAIFLTYDKGNKQIFYKINKLVQNKRSSQ